MDPIQIEGLTYLLVYCERCGEWHLTRAGHAWLKAQGLQAN